MKRTTLSLALLGLFSIGTLPSALAQVSAAPALLNYQGRLATPDGFPVPDGTYSIRFSLHDAVSGGTEKWNQTIANVQVRNGTFAVLLNTNTAGLFHGNLWLETKIGSDAALTPRQQLVSVAYAMKANSVPDGSINTAQLANGAVTGDKLASGTLGNLTWLLGGNAITNPMTQFLGTSSNQPLVFRTNNTEKMRLTGNGFVGIGNAAPNAPLSVSGVGRVYETSDGTREFIHFLGDVAGIANGAYIGTVSNHPLIFQAGNAATSALLPNGNFGVGILAPAARLDVNGNAAIRGANILEFGLGVTKETNAGKIGYQAFTTGALDIVGAGTTAGNRKIKFWNEGGATFAGEVVAPIMTVVGGSDVAEPYNVEPAGEVKPTPGMLVIIHPDKIGQMRVASHAYDTTVAGIISGANGIRPGITLTQKGTVADGEFPVASIGRVWCYCDADTNGSIKPGDLLTSSDTPGHAMKATDRERRDGAVIGKAMSALPSGKGLVLVLVSLK